MLTYTTIILGIALILMSFHSFIITIKLNNTREKMRSIQRAVKSLMNSTGGEHLPSSIRWQLLHILNILN